MKAFAEREKEELFKKTGVDYAEESIFVIIGEMDDDLAERNNANHLVFKVV